MHCLNSCCWAKKIVVARGVGDADGVDVGVHLLVVVSLSGGGSGVDMAEWMTPAEEAVVITWFLQFKMFVLR